MAIFASLVLLGSMVGPSYGQAKPEKEPDNLIYRVTLLYVDNWETDTRHSGKPVWLSYWSGAKWLTAKAVTAKDGAAVFSVPGSQKESSVFVFAFSEAALKNDIDEVAGGRNRGIQIPNSDGLRLVLRTDGKRLNNAEGVFRFSWIK